MPLLPGLTDGEESLGRLIGALQAHGAEYAMPGLLTLRDTGRAYFYSRLEQIAPEALRLTDFAHQQRRSSASPEAPTCHSVR